jgi:hypothetical protein
MHIIAKKNGGSNIMSIQPHWDKKSHPQLWNRTAVKYSRIKTEELIPRGMGSLFVKEAIPLLPFGTYIAGGYVASLINKKLQAGDIDLYFSSEEAFDGTLNALFRPQTECLEGYKTDLTYKQIEDKETAVVKFEAKNKLDIQLIKIAWWDNPDHVLDAFDWTCVQFAIDGSDVVFNPMGIIDLFANKLMVHRIQYHMDALYRLIKYVRKGFNVPPETLDRITQEIVRASQNNNSGASPVRNSNIRRTNPYRGATITTENTLNASPPPARTFARGFTLTNLAVPATNVVISNTANALGDHNDER